MPIKNLAMLSVHTSPLAKLGEEKTGGMNVYIKELAQELDHMGISVTIFTRRTTIEQPDIDFGLGGNIRVIHVNAGPPQTIAPEEIYPCLSHFLTGVLTHTTIHNLQFDLIYSHYWLSGWVAHRLKEIWGIPFVQMFHTLGQMKNRILPDYIPPLSPDLRVRTEMHIVRSADRIIAATPAEQAQLLWLYRANRRKIEIISPGVNTGRFYPMSMSEAKKQLGFSSKTNLLVFAGRIEPLKAVDSIMEALHIIQQNMPSLIANLKFCVIGGNLKKLGNGELKRLQQLRIDLGLQNMVKFLGAKNQDELHAYYAASLAIVMPSDYESFGMVALEAMASGTPVIASQIGGLAFLIQDGKTGFLIPARSPSIIAERISSLLMEPERRQQMGIAAAQLGKNYSWSKIAEQLMLIFEQLTKPSAKVSHHTH